MFPRLLSHGGEHNGANAFCSVQLQGLDRAGIHTQDRPLGYNILFVLTLIPWTIKDL